MYVDQDMYVDMEMDMEMKMMDMEMDMGLNQPKWGSVTVYPL